MPLTRRTSLAALVALGALPLVAGCELTNNGDADASSGPSRPTQAPTGDSTSRPVSSTTVPSTAAADSTSSTRVPRTTTTDAPTTTIATTTTAPAPTTTLPRNLVPVPALDAPLVAVGTNDGAETTRIQLRLIELGFWLQGYDGDYGLTTRQAVMAFQKYVGLEATGSVDGLTAEFLSAITERARAHVDSGTMVEVDKARQLLFVVHNGITLWVFNTSTGSEKPYIEVNKNDPTKVEVGDSVTDNGLFHVNRERPEGWWEGDLGEIYRPKYFNGGIAVHGSNSIPNYPASHGCVRVSVPAMDFIWAADLLPMRIPVWVHPGV